MPERKRPVLFTNVQHEAVIKQLCQIVCNNKYLVDIIWNFAIEFELQEEHNTTTLTSKIFYRLLAIQCCLDLEEALSTICAENEAYKQKFGFRDMRGAGVFHQNGEELHDLSTQRMPIMTCKDNTYFSDRILRQIEDGVCFNLHVNVVYFAKQAEDMRLRLKIRPQVDLIPYVTHDHHNKIKLYYQLVYFRHEYNWMVVAFIDDDPQFFAETYP